MFSAVVLIGFFIVFSFFFFLLFLLGVFFVSFLSFCYLSIISFAVFFSFFSSLFLYMVLFVCEWGWNGALNKVIPFTYTILTMKDMLNISHTDLLHGFMVFHRMTALGKCSLTSL